MEKKMELIINRLIESREKNNISKREAAKLIGVSQPAYLRYESGERAPSIQVIKEMAKVFHTSVEYLTGEVDDSAPTVIEINKDSNELLFNLMECCDSMNDQQAQRLLAYARKLMDSK